VKVERDHHRVVAEVSRSPVPVTAVLVLLAAFQVGVSVVNFSIFGSASLGWMLLSWLVCGGLVYASRFHMQKVMLTVMPDHVVLEVTYPFGRKQLSRIPMAEIHGSRPVPGSYSWWVRLEVRGRDPLFLPCSTRADAERLGEYLQDARAQLPPPVPAPPAALLTLVNRQGSE
jgi:hypothetical protein